MAKKDEQVKVMVDPEVKSALAALATRTGDSMAKIIRDAILWRHKMQLQGIPTCANGRPCFVAHLHLIQQTHATPVVTVQPSETSRLVAPALAANA
jgi:hypothetical protein